MQREQGEQTNTLFLSLKCVPGYTYLYTELRRR